MAVQRLSFGRRTTERYAVDWNGVLTAPIHDTVRIHDISENGLGFFYKQSLQRGISLEMVVEARSGDERKIPLIVTLRVRDVTVSGGGFRVATSMEFSNPEEKEAYICLIKDLSERALASHQVAQNV